MSYIKRLATAANCGATYLIGNYWTEGEKVEGSRLPAIQPVVVYKGKLFCVHLGSGNNGVIIVYVFSKLGAMNLAARLLWQLHTTIFFFVPKSVSKARRSYSTQALITLGSPPGH